MIEFFLPRGRPFEKCSYGSSFQFPKRFILGEILAQYSKLNFVSNYKCV